MTRQTYLSLLWLMASIQAKLERTGEGGRTRCNQKNTLLSESHKAYHKHLSLISQEASAFSFCQLWRPKVISRLGVFVVNAVRPSSATAAAAKSMEFGASKFDPMSASCWSSTIACSFHKDWVNCIRAEKDTSRVHFRPVSLGACFLQVIVYCLITLSWSTLI